MPNFLFNTSIKIKTSSLVKLSVHNLKVLSAKYPSPMIQWAKPIGFNSSYMFEGNILTNLSTTTLYQTLCKSVNNGKFLVEWHFNSLTFLCSLRNNPAIKGNEGGFTFT